MKPVYKNRTSGSSKRIEGDQHRLVGQILDERLRVIALHHFSPRQWLYQVEPPSVGKTRRALKVLGDPLAREPGSFYRLKTAYDRLKRLDSPYVERVYECGLLHDLTPYILVEWEPHGSLYEHLRLRRKPLTWREAKSLFINISRGLSAMHEKGIAHGDLRPQHILLRHPPHGPVIIDACVNSAFGSPPVPGLDRSSAFWAPERRSLSTATAAADMYSLGAIMYHCLHGDPPFTLKTSRFNDQTLEAIKSPVRCIEEAHVDLQPLPCSADMPPHISQLILQLLAKSPRQRPTISEVLIQLNANETDALLATTQDADEGKPDDASTEVMQQLLAAHDSIAPSHQPIIDKLSDSHTDPQANPSVYIMTVLCSIGAIVGLILAKL